MSARHRFVAEILAGPRARDPWRPDVRSMPFAGEARVGSFVEVEVRDGRAHPQRLVAPRGSALAALVRIAIEHGLDPVFPPAVEAEVEALFDGAVPDAPPGTDDPALVDLSALPFVTIDNESSRDLDQALHIEADGAGHRVRYALADAAYYVRPGTALFDEALARGASFYLPGWMVPMLPRALSEGLVSLNPRVPRRAMVFDMRVDERGRCVSTSIVRARIESRAKLTYEGVQAFLDAPHDHPLAREPYAPSLLGLRDVGERRIADATERDVVHYRRRTVEVGLDGARSFVLYAGMRNDVERYGEQLSLLVNARGAELLEASAAPHVQPIYRVHPAPSAERVAELRESVRRLAALHDHDDARWRWAEGVSLARFLDALPREREEDERLARAIERQAILMNERSVFSDVAASHHGVGAELYARFSSPMREIVGVFLHKELWEREAPRGDAIADPDEALRAQVIDAANRAKDLQRRLTELGNRLAIDQLLGSDERRRRGERPIRRGTVMGLSGAKLYLALDEPPIDLKVYTKDLERALGAPLRLTERGLALETDDGRAVARVGEPLDVVVSHRDAKRDRWVLVPVSA